MLAIQKHELGATPPRHASTVGKTLPSANTEDTVSFAGTYQRFSLERRLCQLTYIESTGCE
jgi:hypothetical protein